MPPPCPAPSAFDLRVQLGGEPGGEVLLALAGLGEAVVVGAGGMDEVGDRKIEVAVVVGQAGQAGRGDGDSVVAAYAGDDLLLLRPAQGVVVIPDDLDRGVVGLRPRVVEEDLRHRDGSSLSTRSASSMQGSCDFVREAVVEWQHCHLPPRRLDQPRLAEAQRGAPQSGQALDVFLALVVVDMYPAAAGDDHRSLLSGASADWCRDAAGRRRRGWPMNYRE